MSFPLGDNGLLSGLLMGILFGYVLEGGGLSSPRKLTGQFTLKDWTVFKVMFTAVIVAAAGLWLLETGGFMKATSLYIPTPFYGAMAAGGALIGAGFALGGYCPGTSAAALGTGRGDAAVFIVGMIAGTWAYAGVFDAIKPFALGAKGPARQTVSELIGVPDIVVIVAMVVMAAAGWFVAVRMEKARGGPIKVEDVLDDVPVAAERHDIGHAGEMKHA